MVGRLRTVLACLIVVGSSGRVLHAGDWPMWRADPERSAATSEPLPEKLQPLWIRSFTPRKQAWDDPLNLDLMTYDRVFEPIVKDGRLFVNFNDRDKISAFDAQSGAELWSFFTDGPVRLPAVAWRNNVYFCSDDGFLYCVEAETGNLIWRFHGAPSTQKAIGNQRITSVWPARGGPVIRDDTVYFAASIWPMMGTFLYALDAQTGSVVWVNDATGAHYIKQPHSAPSFAGVAPQGSLVATADDLVVPGGRSVPAVFRRDTGRLRYFEINAGGKGTGGSFVAADAKHFYVHTRLKGTRAFEMKTGVKTAFTPNEPVLAGEAIYSADATKDGVPVIRGYDSDREVIWRVKADGRGDLILAGNKLYAAGKDAISIIPLTNDGKSPKVSKIPVEGRVERLLAADGKLFAVTLEGSIMAFGNSGSDALEPITQRKTPLSVLANAQEKAAALLSAADAQGYALAFGVSDDPLIEALAADSPFTQLAVVNEDRKFVDALRRKLDAAGLYGNTTVHHSTAAEFQAPRYVANVLFVGEPLTTDESVLRDLYETVRPYGGVMHLLAKDNHAALAERIKAMRLEQAKVSFAEHSVVVRRVGRLPGSADWTHQYGDVANSIKSDDRRVKLPLGVLWFGGSSNTDVLPRHGHGPPEQVIGGRLFIQGMNSLSARDVYTGRVLWKREFENLGTFDVYYDETYDDAPLNPKYNQVHIPGANGRGTNYIVTDDRVYIVEGIVCHVLDPATGEILQDIELPQVSGEQKRRWGYVGVYEDMLLAGFGFANYRERNKLSFDADKQLSRNRAGFGSKSLDRAASLGLIAFDRHTGKQLWKVDAKHSFWHNGIVAGGGRVYCLDRTPSVIEAALRRRGVSNADSYRIAAYDAKTGTLDWEINDNIFGTWLGYSDKHDMLLQAGAAASDRLFAEVGRGMAVYHAKDGALNWRNDSINYAGPCILHNDWIITNTNSYSESAGAFHLEDGRQKMVAHPITGEIHPWKMTRAYGCNNIIASEHLLTFRSGAAGFYDLLGESGTGNFGGFKSGCTSNLVVANGVLNAPDYTRTCSCAYQNQTSLALVHMPDLEFWTINPAAFVRDANGKLQRLGVNLGAPGDRRHGDVLWLEYPVVGGPSPPLSVELNPEATFFRSHSSNVRSDKESWVFASGAENVTSVTVGLSLENKLSLKSGIPVSHPNDDAEEHESGEVSLGSSDLELGDDGGSQIIGVRFNRINLDRGAEVRSAYIQFVCDEPSREPTTLLIAMEDTANAKRFRSDRHDVSSRPRTIREVEWRPEPWRRSEAAAKEQQTPDLAPLIRDVVNRDDWKPGNSLAFIISGAGKRVASASRGRGQSAAKLVVDADEPAGSEGDVDTHPYSVRLLFAAPATSAAVRRRFDVSLQGRTMARDLTIDPRAPDNRRFAERTFEDVPIGDKLTIELIPREGTPVLSGIEITAGTR